MIDQMRRGLIPLEFPGDDIKTRRAGLCNRISDQPLRTCPASDLGSKFCNKLKPKSPCFLGVFRARRVAQYRPQVTRGLP